MSMPWSRSIRCPRMSRRGGGGEGSLRWICGCGEVSRSLRRYLCRDCCALISWLLMDYFVWAWPW